MTAWSAQELSAPALSVPALRTPVSVAPRLRITRRGRAVITTLVSLPLIILALTVALNGGGATATATLGSGAYDYVTVQAGQTLWQLAATVAPAEDPREVMSRLVRLNQLDGSDVQPGQRLAVPTEYSH